MYRYRVGCCDEWSRILRIINIFLVDFSRVGVIVVGEFDIVVFFYWSIYVMIYVDFGFICKLK